MSTPRYTADGVKIRPQGGDAYRCGHCDQVIHRGYGVPQAGVDCPRCGTHNRADFSFDLPSEELADLAVELELGAQRFDSRLMASAAAELRAIIPAVRACEDRDRLLLGGDDPAGWFDPHPPGSM